MQGFETLPRISNIMNDKIEVFLIKTADPLLGDVMGYDIHVASDSATVADLMDALDDFAAQNLADCKGCDGCCQERAPLLSADIPTLADLVNGQTPWPAHDVIERFGRLEVDEGVSDVMLRRDTDGVCASLDRNSSCCKIWPRRPFVCRSHLCLPRSYSVERLRQDIVNHGLNELTRLLLAEEATGATPIGGIPLSDRLNADDYSVTAFSGKTDYRDILLKECVEESFWKDLRAERKGS